ncbi:MAG: thioredoxin domain-containing protein [Alphaproteobacteria bacterium]|nr:thioredoxin domain-containing protein [Alphaproteobacteria bacterium]
MGLRHGLAVWLGAGLLVIAGAAPAGAAPVRDPAIPWQAWSDAVFERARQENRFVLLSLQSWWCPWCHTMNEVTYADPSVRAYLDRHYIMVRVDQDSRPDIANRYERWGWPATVLFGPDGGEIVKLRGFYSPEFFLPILEETVQDPTPVDYGAPGGPERGPSRVKHLSEAERAEILAFMDKVWDEENAGWGKSKFVDQPTFIHALERAKAGDRAMAVKARRTITQLRRLIDPETGAMSQISTKPDWSEPKREFPMFAQEAALKTFSQAYALWGDPADREAAERVYRFLSQRMIGPGGGFYSSFGMELGEPGVDRSQYARENGQAVAGLAAYAMATGNEAALGHAIRAAGWVLANRALAGGGFRHGPSDPAGPYLGDTLAMGQAFLLLYQATADRRWLDHAVLAAEFIARTFIDPATGGFATTARPAARHLQDAVKQKDENVAATRFFNLLAQHVSSAEFRTIAETGMGYLASLPILDAYGFLPDVLRPRPS